ncbi:MAG: hypothetical protein ABL864_04170 [Terricaulis sp.]
MIAAFGSSACLTVVAGCTDRVGVEHPYRNTDIEGRLLASVGELHADQLAVNPGVTVICVLDEYVPPWSLTQILARHGYVGPPPPDDMKDVPFGGVGLLFVSANALQYAVLDTDVVLFNNLTTECFTATSATILRDGDVYRLTGNRAN